MTEIEGYWGLIVIIAFLVGMGVPYPWRNDREKRNGSDRRKDQRETLQQIHDMLELLVFTHRPADPPDKKDPSGGGDK